MDRRAVPMVVMLVSLAVAGCQQNERSEPTAVAPAPAAPASTTMTLSADQLMALDWGGRAVDRSTVLERRRVDDGVEFDIRFPGNSEGVCSMDYLSSGTAGKGTLVGLDVSRYQAFALKFTLISVNARKDPNVPLGVAVGAMIGPPGDGKLYACDPVTLSLSSEQVSGVATTPMRTQTIRLIGIHANMVDPQVWDSDGGIVTILVEPAPDAEILPMSATASTSGPNGKKAGTPGSNARTADPSTFGTQHLGAW